MIFGDLDYIHAFFAELAGESACPTLGRNGFRPGGATELSGMPSLEILFAVRSPCLCPLR